MAHCYCMLDEQHGSNLLWTLKALFCGYISPGSTLACIIASQNTLKKIFFNGIPPIQNIHILATKAYKYYKI